MPTGTLLGGRYRVGRMLGEGGMGAVYEGVQEGLDRKVALKVLHARYADDDELRGRFRREAHIVAMLGHPNVVQISDFQTNEGEPPFLVMELLHGENLRDVIRRLRRLPPERVAYIAVQVLAALEAAHRANVVHRDIKPDNIFLERTSAQADLVKVLDFGVAKLLDEELAGPMLTRAGLVVGTLSYMSPEQALGDPIDGRADLYSLAAVMYVALAGKKPFEGATTAALLQGILNEAPAPLAALRPEVGEGLSAIVERALAKRPEDRFASAAEMARALAPYARPTSLDGPESALPSTPVMTIRTPPSGVSSVEPPPPTVAMGPAFAAPQVTLRMRISSVPPPPRRHSFVPWVVSFLVAGAFLILAGVAMLAMHHAALTSSN